MSRVSCFCLGIAIGAATLYGSMHYHIVQTLEGFHTFPKLTPSFANLYVDVRRFTAADWRKHHDLAMASLHAKKSRILAQTGDSAPAITIASSDDSMGPKRPHQTIRISDNSQW